MKELSLKDYSELLSYLDSEIPEVTIKIGASYAMPPNAVIMERPVALSQEEYDLYVEKSTKWLTDNGFI